MEFSETSKIVFGAVTAISTIAVTLFNLSQARKIKAELLEKFEIAIEKSQKHSVAELFRLIHGLRMSYSDIVELIKHDECLKIIYAIKKMPKVVNYKNGKFEYTSLGRNKVFQFLNLWINRFGVLLFSILSLISFALFAFVKGPVSILSFLLLMIFSFLLAMQIQEREYDKMVFNLIENEHNKANSADAKNRAAD